ncbi:MAG TPA: hypothetical protein VE007_02755 [Thermoanaerobaculia bacterium]|nr:hypothetical protein [Thermoanaerobaculia bacterium]
MNRENVVPFISSEHGALARRGAPDKSRRPDKWRKLAPMVDVECPLCGATLFVDAASVLARPEILCAGCDSTISVERGETG